MLCSIRTMFRWQNWWTPSSWGMHLPVPFTSASSLIRILSLELGLTALNIVEKREIFATRNAETEKLLRKMTNTKNCIIFEVLKIFDIPVRSRESQTFQCKRNKRTEPDVIALSRCKMISHVFRSKNMTSILLQVLNDPADHHLETVYWTVCRYTTGYSRYFLNFQKI